MLRMLLLLIYFAFRRSVLYLIVVMSRRLSRRILHLERILFVQIALLLVLEIWELDRGEIGMHILVNICLLNAAIVVI